ncbi:YopX family protein [Clostridium celatum]|uniref:YopX protein domain-containing protein n=1 Tax=Clostridium celatum DSM 1785 TaxID=545697 RepID=L1QCW6_9CLOT|nr:YopX family protein [Clostridium celatum]EKY25804.1 hypothetical protein HMPREF0216_02386 [Clostridium celatum DSM 1785]MCE9653670.1 YopX family protein [Clostridium celatum]MDU2265396.1 YopX family protein [Clostridium celatum]MDU3722019.1 YopX family protein [Clostridium celatum]MDU6295028.1 YopX family protein [Clostridium celatum]
MDIKINFKIYNKILNKCFSVTRIDYIDKQIYYLNKDKNEEAIVSFDDSILLLPTGIHDASGREIFQGDVISYQENSFTYKKTAEVIYENGCFFTKQILPKNIALTAQKENLDLDNFKDLLYLSTLSTTKPVKIIGNIFSYKPSKNSGKIKITV